MSVKQLIKDKLCLTKGSVSKVFNVGRKDVSVSMSYEETSTDTQYSMHVSIYDPTEPLSFDLLTKKTDSIRCNVFGVDVATCTLTPKLPGCRNCPLAR
jgi:hypothetical protein